MALTQQSALGSIRKRGFASGGTSPYVANVPVGGTSGAVTSPYIASIGANGLPSGTTAQSGNILNSIPGANPSSITTAQSFIPSPNAAPSSSLSSTSNDLNPRDAEVTQPQNSYEAAFDNMLLGTSFPGAAFKKGGRARLANGGIPTSSDLDPWYTRSEERGMIQPEGLIKSMGAGRTDVHNINVPTGSYVIPSDVVSGLSEGNTLGGAAVIDRMMHSNPYGIEGGSKRGGMGLPRAPAAFRQPTDNMESRGGKTGGKANGSVPIVIAGGEFLLHPETIAKKFGSLKKGHAVLDKFVRETRKKNVKTLSKLPGPKT